MEMWRCAGGNVEMCRFVDVEMCRCGDVEMLDIEMLNLEF